MDAMGQWDYADYAQEFLRRDPQYQAAYRMLSPHSLSLEHEEMARQWGLAFPVRSNARYRRTARILVARNTSRNCRARSRAYGAARNRRAPACDCAWFDGGPRMRDHATSGAAVASWNRPCHNAVRCEHDQPRGHHPDRLPSRTAISRSDPAKSACGWCRAFTEHWRRHPQFVPTLPARSAPAHSRYHGGARYQCTRCGHAGNLSGAGFWPVGRMERLFRAAPYVSADPRGAGDDDYRVSGLTGKSALISICRQHICDREAIRDGSIGACGHSYGQWQ